MPVRRGKDSEYIENALDTVMDVLRDKDYFKDASDICQAAMMRGALDCYSKNIIPGYLLETEDHYS